MSGRAHRRADCNVCLVGVAAQQNLRTLPPQAQQVQGDAGRQHRGHILACAWQSQCLVMPSLTARPHLPGRQHGRIQRRVACSCQPPQRGRRLRWKLHNGAVTAGAQAALRIRPVCRQLQHGHAVQLFLPIRDAARQLPAAKAPALPGRVVCIVHLQRRQVRRALGPQRTVERLEFRQKDTLWASCKALALCPPFASTQSTWHRLEQEKAGHACCADMWRGTHLAPAINKRLRRPGTHDTSVQAASMYVYPGNQLHTTVT